MTDFICEKCGEPIAIGEGNSLLTHHKPRCTSPPAAKPEPRETRNTCNHPYQPGCPRCNPPAPKPEEDAERVGLCEQIQACLLNGAFVRREHYGMHPCICPLLRRRMT